tara:strand:- start:439 stop:1206 length:768 start_codon:yes stop_codon:yes gene_type:complete
MATKAAVGSEITIMEVEKGEMHVCILGTTPFLCNAMPAKAWHQLLAPSGKKGAAEKASTMKHDPVDEYRNSIYRLKEGADTLVATKTTGFKKSMMSAALDAPGTKKTQIGRLVYVHGELTPVFGIPQLHMTIVRSADMNRTPDVRTRAILQEWACHLKVTYTQPLLRQQSIVNLLAAAGFQSGMGDWRQEKGSSNYGSFRLVGAKDPDFVRITKTMGRQAQIEAMENPVCYDLETEELLSWFNVEKNRRGFKVAA